MMKLMEGVGPLYGTSDGENCHGVTEVTSLWLLLLSGFYQSHFPFGFCLCLEHLNTLYKQS